jgi:hypothetical protein
MYFLDITFIADAVLYLFFLSVSYRCVKEGLRGILKKECLTLFNPPHFSGKGAEALVWGLAYLSLGLLYVFFTVESTVKLLSLL